MGDIADYLIEQMMDGGMTPGMGYACRRGRKRQEPRKPKDPKAFDEDTRAREYPGKNTPAHLLQEYPEKTFDMGFFPTIHKKEKPMPFADLMDEEAPF